MIHISRCRSAAKKHSNIQLASDANDDSGISLISGLLFSTVTRRHRPSVDERMRWGRWDFSSLFNTIRSLGIEEEAQGSSKQYNSCIPYTVTLHLQFEISMFSDRPKPLSVVYKVINPISISL